jgi:hypothetical protein
MITLGHVHRGADFCPPLDVIATASPGRDRRNNTTQQKSYDRSCRQPNWSSWFQEALLIHRTGLFCLANQQAHFLTELSRELCVVYRNAG